MEKRKPVRQCIGCGMKGEKSKFIRIVKHADGTIVLDITGKSDGRGAYICNSAECFAKMSKGRKLDRSFRTSVGDMIYKNILEEFDRLEK